MAKKKKCKPVPNTVTRGVGRKVPRPTDTSSSMSAERKARKGKDR